MTNTTAGRVATPHTLRGRSSAETRSAVLDLIRSSGVISRVDLARRSSLTEATISKIVKELLAADFVVHAGFAESTGGKRPALLRLNDGGVYALGLTLDYNECTIVLCGADGTELTRSQAPGVGRDDPPMAFDRLAAAIEDLLSRQRVDRSAITGLGVASAGRRGHPLGWVDASFFDVWEPYDVEEELARRTRLAVVRENDADCAALGEFWTSQGSARDFVVVYMSHGIGCGIVINGAIYRGASGNAGEIGHTNVDPKGLPCWCGSRGCLETVASPRAVVRNVLADARLRSTLSVDGDTEEAEVYRRFAERAAAGGDRAIARILATATGSLAAVVGNLVNTLDLDLVVLAGSGYAGVGDAFLTAVRTRVEQTAFMRELHPITVRLAATGSESAALGAASAVLHRHLTPHRSAAAT